MYLFALKEEGGTRCLVFPQNPAELTIAAGVDHETYRLMDAGEIVLPGFAGLRTIRFTAIFGAEEAAKLALLESFARDRLVLRLIISRSSLDGERQTDTNLPVVLQSVSLREKGGEPGVVFADLSLREYRAFGLRVMA